MRVLRLAIHGLGVAAALFVGCSRSSEPAAKTPESVVVESESPTAEAPGPTVLAAVRVDQRSTFITLDGSPAFGEQAWDMAYPFSSGVAMVIANAGELRKDDGRDFAVGGLYRLIDAEGKEVSDRDYPSIVHAREGVVSVRGMMGQHLERLDGTQVGKDFEEVGNVREGRVVAVGMADGEPSLGWLDTSTGKWVVSWPRGEFKQLCRFFDGLACAQNAEGQCGWYTPDGTVAIPVRYDACGNFHDGVAWAGLPGAHVGVIEKTGRFVVEQKYDEITDASEERMFVKVGERWGLLDTTGRVILEPQFFAVRSFSEGWASVLREGGGGTTYIDREGAVVLELEFRALDFHFDRAIYFDNDTDKAGFIDRTGAPVIPATFDTVHNFGDVAVDNPPAPLDWTR
ncbi:MAG: WG repeat-containing protein [Myxococcota bacterium]